jgi:Fur family transcriptional regulator, iron response regulator
MSLELAKTLKLHGVQPSAQRLAVAEHVLSSKAHPSADQVLEVVQARLPMVSRATVYNTLNLLVKKGLLRQLVLAEGRVVFDPNLMPHHHFIDDDSGLIEDVPWAAVPVGEVTGLKGYDVREYMVVMRGRKVGAPAKKPQRAIRHGMLESRPKNRSSTAARK